MKMFIRSLTLLLSVCAVSADAKTLKYDLQQLGSGNTSSINYRGLDFSGATSAILTITKTPPSIETQISSLELSFPKVAKLTASNFKLVDTVYGKKYRALVSGAWIFKEVIVELDARSIYEPNAPLGIQVFVSEKSVFINPQADNQGTELFRVDGLIRDITPTRIVDTESTVVKTKKLTLSLRDRMATDPLRGSSGYMVDALWFGKGSKTLYMEPPFPAPEADNFEPYDLIVEGVEPNLQVKIKFRDVNGSERESYAKPLQSMLDEAYGISFP